MRRVIPKLRPDAGDRLSWAADPLVPYGEGGDPDVVVSGGLGNLPGARHNMAQWAQAAGCSEKPEIERIEPDVERWTYSGCNEGIGVELYTIEHGSHVWPGSDPGPSTHTINASDLILDWFDAHHMGR